MCTLNIHWFVQQSEWNCSIHKFNKLFFYLVSVFRCNLFHTLTINEIKIVRYLWIAIVRSFSIWEVQKYALPKWTCLFATFVVIAWWILQIHWDFMKIFTIYIFSKLTHILAIEIPFLRSIPLQEKPKIFTNQTTVLIVAYRSA